MSKLVQVDNRNQFMSTPINSNKSPEELRNLYGEQIEGERVVVYDDNDVKHVWIYKNGKYINE